MGKEHAEQAIREEREMRLQILKEQGSSVDLRNAMKAQCQACDAVTAWEDQIEAGIGEPKALLCPTCYMSFRTEYEQTFKSYDAMGFVTWKRNLCGKTNCVWCEAPLDPAYNYCRKCGR